tara:strand:- start:216 stop:389 length:174 start_codon:yes stop_codon:yes gene_type:complete
MLRTDSVLVGVAECIVINFNDSRKLQNGQAAILLTQKTLMMQERIYLFFQKFYLLLI